MDNQPTTKEFNYCPTCHMFSVLPNHCDNCGGKLVYRTPDVPRDLAHSVPQVDKDVEAVAKEIVGTVFRQTTASHETFERVMVERIADYLRAHSVPPDRQPGGTAAGDVRMFPIQHASPIEWSLAERAYATYAESYGTDQSLERLAQRGGFGLQEFACLFAGHEPRAKHEECVAKADAVGRSIAELRQRAERGQDWQPIATAPRDATPILVALIADGKVWRVSDAKYYGVGFYTVHGGNSCHWATHFMPFPHPQKGDE